MPPLSPARLALTIVPALLLALIAASTIWGDGGLLVRFQLEGQKERALQENADLTRENARLAREITVLEQDPRAVEREVADAIGRAREGATLYTFGEAPPAKLAPPPPQPE
jgi:cell division protein FtsB